MSESIDVAGYVGDRTAGAVLAVLHGEVVALRRRERAVAAVGPEQVAADDVRMRDPLPELVHVARLHDRVEARRGIHDAGQFARQRRRLRVRIPHAVAGLRDRVDLGVEVALDGAHGRARVDQSPVRIRMYREAGAGQRADDVRIVARARREVGVELIVTQEALVERRRRIALRFDQLIELPVVAVAQRERDGHHGIGGCASQVADAGEVGNAGGGRTGGCAGGERERGRRREDESRDDGRGS